MNERIVRCTRCNGDGGWERIHNDMYPSAYNGDPPRSWSPCVECDGTGEIIVVTSLVDFYDMDAPEFTGRWPEAFPAAED